MRAMRLTQQRAGVPRQWLARVLGLVALAGLLVGADARPADTLVLVEKGRPRAEIVVGQDASAQAQLAAAELQTYLQRITGAELPIVQAATTALFWRRFARG